MSRYQYYQLEASIAGHWEPVPGHVYSTRDFRQLLDSLKPAPGQRLRRIRERVIPDFICTNKGIQRWGTRY